MRRFPLLPRLAAAALALALLLTPARALTVEQARELLAGLYVDPVPQEVLDQPTIPEMLDALGDPYTRSLTAREYAAFLASMSDISQVGIGVSALALSDGFFLVDVMEDSPAAQGGLRPGDLIVAVDGVPLAGMSPEQMTALIQGEEGTRLTLTYLRQNIRRAVTLTRGVYALPATTGMLLDNGVGYISCDTWGDETLGHFQTLIGEMESQADCWLIDLRYNGGGITQAAVDTAGLFCGEDSVVALRMREDTSPDGYAYDLVQTDIQAVTAKPVVILVNGDTASSSELFASLLQDSGRGLVVGSRTYGKGVAQAVLDQEVAPDYFPDGDCLMITIARAFTVLGNTTDAIGVIPRFPADDDDAPQLALELAQTLAQTQLEGGDWTETARQLLDSRTRQDSGFSDADGHPYERAIAVLSAYGLARGKGDGKFHPEDPLTRAELAQMLQYALNSRAGAGDALFDDVPADAWYAPAVEAAARMGLMDGVGDGRFAPDRALTRQELFAVLGRLGRRLNDDLDHIARTAPDGAFDLPALDGYADWAREPVWLLTSASEELDDPAGLLWDDPAAIDPAAQATRGEAAFVLYGLLSYLSILP